MQVVGMVESLLLVLVEGFTYQWDTMPLLHNRPF